MSSFLKRGKRIKARADKKVVKKSTKEFYKIIGELDRVAHIMVNDETIMEKLTEDNLVELAQPLTNIEIAGLEKMVLMGKVGIYNKKDEKESTE